MGAAIISEERHGAGDPCFVLLHGWGRDLRYFRPMAKLLARHGTVHNLTLPGFGKTPPPAEAWGSFEYAQYVREYFARHGIDRAVVIGHSFGGRVALHLSQGHPTLVSALVLIGSAGLRARRKPLAQLRLKWIRTLGKLARVMDSLLGTRLKEKHHQNYASRDYRSASPEMRGVLVRVVNEDQSDVARGVTQPTLLLWGEHDTETPVEMGERFSQLIPQSQFIVLEGKDHTPFEQLPDLCAAYILRFLASRLPANRAAV